jgi:hypothetical protein
MWNSHSSNIHLANVPRLDAIGTRNICRTDNGCAHFGILCHYIVLKTLSKNNNLLAFGHTA